ncbi:HNH endonuclease [Streptomyces lavendulae]|uniref:HNH endonuclease n=1 Tax=Streptomyces lavendulae TaxID=1914 RepID=UPI0034092EDE
MDAFDRFVSSVDISAGPDACWVWKSFCTAKGYGQFQVGGKKKRAHRWIVEHIIGSELEPEIFVCHHCDNPPCVNPRHLYVGDVLDNNRDKAAKGRHPGGWHGNQYTGVLKRCATPTSV